jgi:hypothetical protein
MSRVRGFLELFRPGIEYDIVSLNDVYGPTGTDPDIQALVVSRETVGGAESSESRSLLPLRVSSRLIAYLLGSCYAPRSIELSAVADVRDRCN